MLNVALFGSSLYIKPLLTTLLESDSLSLSLFVTKPDLSHFSDLIAQYNIQTFTPDSYTKENIAELINNFQRIRIDIGIVADYGHMIPLSIIKSPPFGLINIHFSKLPEFRGACPVQYTILHGKEKAAFTILEMLPDGKPQVDSGKIIFQNEYHLNGTETTEELYTDLFIQAAHDIESVVLDYTNKNILPTAQDPAEVTFTTPSGKFDRTTLLKKEDAYVSSEDVDIYLYRAIRAFTPWPRAYTTLEELLQITQRFDPTVSKIIEGKDKDTRIQLLEGHLENGKLILDIVQADGKKPAPWKEFKNGYFQ